MVNLAANMSARHMVALVAPSEMHYTIDFYVSNCLKLFLPCGEVYSILIQSGGNGRTWWAQLLDSFLHLFVFLLSQRSSWSRQLATGQHASYSCQSSPQLILILNICTDLLSFPVQNPLSRHHKTDFRDWQLLVGSSKLAPKWFIWSDISYKTNDGEYGSHYNNQGGFSIIPQVDDFWFCKEARHTPCVKQYISLILALNCICTLYLSPPLQPGPVFFPEQCQLLQAEK